MSARRFTLLLLVALLCLPGLALAQSAEDAEPAAAAKADCKFPTELLWHTEKEGESFRLGVSVLNENQQQVPGLRAQHFKVFVDDTEVERGSDTFKVQQSKNVFTEAATEAGAEEGASLGVDPVHYDLYFALDLTASMAEAIEVKGQPKPRSKINVVANRIHELFVKEKLFDSNDRVYISGFTSRLEASFMTETTADRKALAEGLRSVLKFAPQGSDAALYYAMDFNMKTIRDRAQFYSGDTERRQAVVIVVTDSFNGMNMDASRRVSRCRDNDRLTETMRESVRATSEATGGNFKLYMLAIGNPGETSRYKLEGKLSSRCNIRSTQDEVVDKRSFRAIASDLQKGRGGFVAHPDPIKLLRVVQGQFESLRRAYEISYLPPEGVTRPKKFKVAVEIGSHTCADEVTETSGFIRKTAAQGRTQPEEVALLLAALIFIFFFIPRSIANVSTVMGGGRSRAPKAAPKKKGKGRKKRRK